MSYYWSNRKALLQKAQEKYDNGGKEKAAECYRNNKDVTKQKANNKYKNYMVEPIGLHGGTNPIRDWGFRRWNKEFERRRKTTRLEQKRIRTNNK